MASWLRRSAQLERLILCSLVIVMCLAVLLQISSRYLFRNPVFFAEEVSLISYVWLSFLGMGYATKKRTHIQMQLFHDHLPVKLRYTVEILSLAISLLIMIVLFVVSLNFLTFDRYARTPALRLSNSVLNLAVVIGVFLNIVQLLRESVALLRRGKP